MPRGSDAHAVLQATQNVLVLNVFDCVQQVIVVFGLLLLSWCNMLL